jgi:phosphohistidine phosphatase
VILYFLRHGDAGEPRPTDDDARELSPKGEAALRSAAPIWRTLKLRPDVVISSPLPRALRTAELLVEGIGSRADIVVDDRLRPGAAWSDLLAAMADRGHAERVLFVGHEPDLSGAVETLTGAAAIRLRKAGLACVELKAGADEPGRGELAWLLDPDLYRPEPDAGR